MAFVCFFLRQGEAFSALYFSLFCLLGNLELGFIFIYFMLGLLSNNILLCKGSMLHGGRQQRRNSKKSSKSFCLLVRMKDFSLIC